MIAIPFPFFIAEIVIFVLAVEQWGFWATLGFYFLPCLLGLLIVTTVGRMAMMTLQSTVVKGQLPANKILHSGAVFLSGLLFLVPSFFTRVFAVILLLPGLRHLAVWQFKIFMAKQMAKGTAKVFNFGSGPFGFGGAGGANGFKYYQFRNDGRNSRQPDDMDEISEEREITDVQVVDVTPIEITHEEKKPKEDK